MTGFEPATSASRTHEGSAETPDKQGRNDADVSVCTRVCTNCCRALTTLDNSNDFVRMALRSALQEIIAGGNDGHGTKPQRGSQANDRAKGTGEALLKAIRLLVELPPKERTALIGFLKALGE